MRRVGSGFPTNLSTRRPLTSCFVSATETGDEWCKQVHDLGADITESEKLLHKLTVFVDLHLQSFCKHCHYLILMLPQMWPDNCCQ